MADKSVQTDRRFQRERTARLQAERLLEEKADELYESLMQVQSSENLLRSALTSMADGLLLTNQYHEVILANQQLGVLYPEQADLFQRGANLVGSFDELLSHPSYLEMLDEGGQEAFFEIELPGEHVVSVSVSYTREGFIASTHRDITQLKAAEEERRRLLVDLLRSQRMETIGRMSGMIAHDFNNIIASIKGYAGFLLEDLVDDSGSKDSARRIATAAEKGQQLIQQILEYGKQQQAPRHRVSLIPVLEECLDMVGSTLPQDIELGFKPPEQPIWVEANETRLSQLFMNLLTNALRAVGSSNGRLSIIFDCFDRLELGQEQSKHPDFPAGAICSAFSGQVSFASPCVRVSVIDTGVGIEPAVMDRIFEMYFTTRDASHGGVGMSSVADITADYGGGIKLTSLPGTGTAVEIVFPRVDPSPSLPGSDTPMSSYVDARACDVMVIDDDENVGDMIRQVLERNGITAECYTSAQTALDLLLEDHSRWKVILSDQIMPQLKGSDIFVRLREAGISTPFIMCSAQIDPASAEIHDWLKDDFVRKPIVQQELLEKIRGYL